MFSITKLNINQPAVLRDLLALRIQPLDILDQLRVGDLHLAGQHEVHAGSFGLRALRQDLEVRLASQG